ncbi:Acg family FMN-binding oxidoreductase [Streptomyces sp. NBC_01236]|uniref:Acg family FMN-binding oxidoreductase n=1 Tax=Streptomyces sp. NBC_01236 TaxID=2903789 RepID=UPI002E0D87D6|nr:nitroreductase family protein [Streptomyces sp. NBC_01236]
MTAVCVRPSHASTYLVRAAITAPSVYNTQPWTFVMEEQDKGIELHADLTRRLPLTDPYGREAVISCGSALFNVRVAMRHLGFSPVVRTFPHPQDSSFLAQVTWGAYGRPSHDEQRMYAALRRRHSVRGPFLARPLPSSLIDELREQARGEGATLHYLDDSTSRRHLAELVRADEDTHRTDPGYVAEQSRWTWQIALPRTDVAPADADVMHPDCTSLAGRDHSALSRMFPAPPRRWPARTGLVAVMSTDRDDRPDWLRAGQALERVLLYAAAHGVMAALHTQPLELPHLRAQVRRTLSMGEFPQMILRLGYPP